jgi:hypothetical protein
MTYLPSGFAQAAGAGQLVFCDSRGNEPSAGELSAARAITISPTGRAGVTRGTAEIQEMIDAIGVSIGGCTAS